MTPGANEAVTTLLPELVLVLAAVVGLLAGSFLPRRRQGLVRAGAVLAVVAAGVLSAVGLARPAELVFSGTYAVDAGLGVLRLVVLAATALTLLLAAEAIGGNRRETEVVVLVLLAALGTIVLAGANDLLVLAAGFLLTSLPLYALTGFTHTRRSTEAALKQYLLGALAGVLMLVGVAVLLGAGGGTDYPTLATGLPAAARITVVLGVVALVAGLLFELGAVPLHFWVPDVTQAASTPVAAFTSTVPKLGAALALYRLLDVPLAGTGQDWSLLVAVIAAASMTLGNLAAFAQDDVRRLLGYSAISQVGYLLMAVAVAGRAELALSSLLLYLAAYAVTNLGAFAVVAALPHARTLADFRGLARTQPWLAGALVVCLLGLVGTPPTAVFAGKLTVFTAAGDGGLGWLVVVAAINTVASLFYYLRWIAPAVRGGGQAPTVDPWARAAAVTAAVSSLALGVLAGPALDLVNGTLAR
ncbi:NADH-quinone oxidoreductase subunit N [Rhodococcus antarcticus]|uniref:NADH-quinone oxidoreductase subunit N n=1 Tax=Rhodococcus antarcticus TaxID=2987751 RepID=A0ABY6P3N5_9NOCA|nr:NADH-quinone oxidoreductase subunit N [Rhodococcus antarcticus]UZJ26262.1 NADH-quinone oxidoreductase subunit N [Rhodococcus antarcticus]